MYFRKIAKKWSAIYSSFDMVVVGIYFLVHTMCYAIHAYIPPSYYIYCDGQSLKAE